MLEAAREQRADGVDVVVGYVETHGRAETDALLDGLEILPRRPLDYRGTTLPEFDLDGSAAAPTRHASWSTSWPTPTRRAPATPSAGRTWSSCWTPASTSTPRVNVQHVESLNDVVAKITGVVMRETVPDSVFEQADEVELIDLPPDDLLAALPRGQGLPPGQAQEALEPTSSARAT